MKILDCTLRDGGYYTNWDFSQELAINYYKLMKSLPVDIIEIGYRGNPDKKNTYYGEYYFLTVSNLKKIKSIIGNKKKLSIMVDLKDWDGPRELHKNLLNITDKIYEKKLHIIKIFNDHIIKIIKNPIHYIIRLTSKLRRHNVVDKLFIKN